MNLGETIYKEILISDKYTLELKLIKCFKKDNNKYYIKVYLDKIRVYKYILYKDYRLYILENYYLIHLSTIYYLLIVEYLE